MAANEVKHESEKTLSIEEIIEKGKQGKLSASDIDQAMEGPRSS